MSLCVNGVRVFSTGACLTKKLTLKGTNGLFHKISPITIQIATIKGLARKDPADDWYRPKPWPYEKKRWGGFHQYFSWNLTSRYFGENSKIISVEGNIACGKTDLAKILAEEFGMKLFPKITLDEVYINRTGFDYRVLNKYLPELTQAVDFKLYCENPEHDGVTWMKTWFYHSRFSQYFDVLAHLFNTGQGCVIDRSPWSDFVFNEVMHNFGHITKEARDWYYRNREHTINEIKRPHLIIYLDVPPEVLMERIKKRGRPHEINGKLITLDYLREIERQYKQFYLPEIVKHSEVLMYDWSEYGDVEDVIEDIEKIDFDNYDPHCDKMQDWYIYDPQRYDVLRRCYTNWKHWYVCLNIAQAPLHDVPGLFIEQEDAAFREELFLYMNPDYEFVDGFHPKTDGLWRTLFGHELLDYRQWLNSDLNRPYK